MSQLTQVTYRKLSKKRKIDDRPDVKTFTPRPAASILSRIKALEAGKDSKHVYIVNSFINQANGIFANTWDFLDMPKGDDQNDRQGDSTVVSSVGFRAYVGGNNTAGSQILPADSYRFIFVFDRSPTFGAGPAFLPIGVAIADIINDPTEPEVSSMNPETVGKDKRFRIYYDGRFPVTNRIDVNTIDPIMCQKNVKVKHTSSFLPNPLITPGNRPINGMYRLIVIHRSTTPGANAGTTLRYNLNQHWTS